MGASRARAWSCAPATPPARFQASYEIGGAQSELCAWPYADAATRPLQRPCRKQHGLRQPGGPLPLSRRAPQSRPEKLAADRRRRREEIARGVPQQVPVVAVAWTVRGVRQNYELAVPVRQLLEEVDQVFRRRVAVTDAPDHEHRRLHLLRFYQWKMGG